SEVRLRDALAAVREQYAYVLLDCPPSLGPLTVNALVAADRVIVPVQTEYFALEGLAGLLDTLQLIQRELNPRLTVAGMLLTMHDGRTRLARDVEREVREHFPELVFDTVIPRNVRPVAGGTYEIVAGERRWRAAQLAGLERIPAVVRDHDDAASLEVALVENMAREDLNPVEEARAVAALVEELGLSREAVGKKVGRSRVAISNLLRILDLPDEALELLEDGRLTEGHGRALLMAPDHADRRRLARAAAEQGWSVRVTEDQARAAAA